MKILILGAHPDDQILSCGGVWHNHLIKKDKVMDYVFSKGRDDKYDQKFDTLPLKHFIDKIEKIIEDFSPDIIYTHHLEDMNKDHRIIAEATIIATRGLKIEIYGYEVFSTSGSFSFNPDTYKILDGSDIGWKAGEMKRNFPDELREHPHPRSVEGINILAIYRGMQINTKYAEAFKTLRRII